MKLFRNLTVVALTAAVMMGCSSKGKKELPPAELVKFPAEIALKKEWSRSIGNGQGKLWNNLEPAVDGGHIYAADAEGVVVAMDRYTGAVEWKKKLKLPVSGGVGVAEGMVMLGTLEGTVIVLDQYTGEEKWRAQVPSEVLSAPSTNGDVVIVQTQDDRLIALDASTGEQRWIYENNPAVLSLRGTSKPIVTQYVVFAGLSTGKVIAVDTQRGLPVWEQQVAIPSGRTELERMVDIDGDMLLVGPQLFITSYQGQIAALDAQTGQIMFQREASSYVGAAEGYGNLYVSLAEGAVQALDERSATVLWKNDSLLRRQLSAPAALSSYVAVGDFQGYLHILSQVDGRFVYRDRVDSKGLRAQPIVVDGWMYVYGNGGKLVALTIK